MIVCYYLHYNPINTLGNHCVAINSNMDIAPNAWDRVIIDGRIYEVTRRFFDISQPTHVHLTIRTPTS